jgi:hypothetical protein
MDALPARPLSTSAATTPTPLETATLMASATKNGWAKQNPT